MTHKERHTRDLLGGIRKDYQSGKLKPELKRELDFVIQQKGWTFKWDAVPRKMGGCPKMIRDHDPDDLTMDLNVLLGGSNGRSLAKRSK